MPKGAQRALSHTGTQQRMVDGDSSARSCCGLSTVSAFGEWSTFWQLAKPKPKHSSRNRLSCAMSDSAAPSPISEAGAHESVVHRLELVTRVCSISRMVFARVEPTRQRLGPPTPIGVVDLPGKEKLPWGPWLEDGVTNSES